MASVASPAGGGDVRGGAEGCGRMLLNWRVRDLSNTRVDLCAVVCSCVRAGDVLSTMQVMELSPGITEAGTVCLCLRALGVASVLRVVRHRGVILSPR